MCVYIANIYNININYGKMICVGERVGGDGGGIEVVSVLSCRSVAVVVKVTLRQCHLFVLVHTHTNPQTRTRYGLSL